MQVYLASLLNIAKKYAYCAVFSPFALTFLGDTKVQVIRQKVTAIDNKIWTAQQPRNAFALLLHQNLTNFSPIFLAFFFILDYI